MGAKNVTKCQRKEHQWVTGRNKEILTGIGTGWRKRTRRRQNWRINEEVWITLPLETKNLTLEYSKISEGGKFDKQH